MITSRQLFKEDTEMSVEKSSISDEKVVQFERKRQNIDSFWRIGVIIITNTVFQDLNNFELQALFCKTERAQGGY